jgi:hypothetical protein
LQVSTSHAGLPFSYKQSTKRRNTTGNAQNERALNEDTQLKSVLAHSFTTEHDLISDEKEMIHLRDGCGLHDPFGDFPSATNNVKPTQGGAAARRRHGLEVEDEGLLKDLVVIFVFLELFCTVRCFF